MFCTRMDPRYAAPSSKFRQFLFVLPFLVFPVLPGLFQLIGQFLVEGSGLFQLQESLALGLLNGFPAATEATIGRIAWSEMC